MAKIAHLCAALAAASLTGCAGLSADVHTVSSNAAVLEGEQTYSLARTQPQDDSADHPQAEKLLRDELVKHGFVDTAGKPAHYLLSIAYSTRPASIGIGGEDCAPGDCGAGSGGLGALLWGREYQHALTLRFFDYASGTEGYKVNAVFKDRDADPLHAMPLLVKTAFAKLPFDAPADWRVKFSIDKSSGVPNVESMKPLPR
ncbi:putative lipoprotein [Burkholderia sp. H160]|nr:putative lipoprotein [Burkholderia sp. H160]